MRLGTLRFAGSCLSVVSGAEVSYDPPPDDTPLLLVAACPLLLPIRADQALPVSTGSVLAVDGLAVAESDALADTTPSLLFSGG